MPRRIPDHEREHIRRNWRRWDVLTAREAAAVLGCSENVIRSAMRGGQVPTRAVGKRTVVPVQALDDWLKSGQRSEAP